MILEKQISDAKFVLSKDELPYTEVLEDFDNTEFIYVLTYNIWQGQHELVYELKKHSDAEICVVTNIPRRWEKYYGDVFAEKAKKTIKLYKSRLDLENCSIFIEKALSMKIELIVRYTS